MRARLSTDGGSRGNPGPAAFAYVLETEDGTVLDARGEAIGVATNNVAEYRGLVEGLRSAVERGVEERVPELRLETVFPEERQADVVAALRGAHPYEEPAFDVYPLL